MRDAYCHVACCPAIRHPCVHESGACPSPPSQEDTGGIIALRALVTDLQRRLSTKLRRCERAEQRHETVRLVLSEANAALRTAHEKGQH